MRVTTFVLLLGACGASVPVTSTDSRPSAPPPRKHFVSPSTELDALVRRSQQALADDRKLDYDRPFVAKSRERPETVALLADACHAGHKPSCWKAATIATPDDQPKLWGAVAANCRSGDSLSCRALPDQATADEAAYTDLPGTQGRTDCKACDATEVARMRRECAEGFAASCFSMSTLSPAEHDELAARAQKLSAEDCAADITYRCSGLHDLPVTEQLVMYEHLCALKRDACGPLSDVYDQLKRPREARDAFERGCQYGMSPNLCAALGAAYLQHKYEEPVVGRGRKLLDTSCRKLGPYAAGVPACKLANSSPE